MSTLPDVRVGDPIRHEALAVFPLFSALDAGLDYLLSDEAIQAGAVTVEEVSEGGSVPNLLVTNRGILVSSSSRARNCGGPSRTGS